MEIITITNNKGGTSKTTTAQSLAIGLAMHNKKVLLVDSDPQGNLSYVFKVLNAPNNLYTMYTGASDINNSRYRASFIQDNKTYNIDIIPSSKKLANADNEFTREPYISIGCQTLLKTQIDKIKNDYDYIIIDTPPTLSILTLNALVSSTSAIVPMNADIFSIQGLASLKEKIDLINSNLNPNLHIKGILLTKYNERAILNRDLRASIEQATKQFNTKVFNTYIRESVAVRESQTNGTSVLLQYPNNNASIDYMIFTNELIKDKEREDIL